MRASIYLFPSTTGVMRSRSVLDKPFRDVLTALGWSIPFGVSLIGGEPSTTSRGKRTSTT
jgi:hypothetical protein